VIISKDEGSLGGAVSAAIAETLLRTKIDTAAVADFIILLGSLFRKWLN
jgi:hypothetical protein